MVGKYDYIHTPVDQLLKYAVKICLSKRIPLLLTTTYVTFPSTP